MVQAEQEETGLQQSSISPSWQLSAMLPDGRKEWILSQLPYFTLSIGKLPDAEEQLDHDDLIS